jgi:hypothetical protein
MRGRPRISLALYPGYILPMNAPLLLFLLKLPLALFVFLLIAYAGTANKRIAGVLLTFPILNGIAIIASPEPVTVADAIYPLVIFNCVLFALVISFPNALPPVGALPRTPRLFARVIVWSIAWVAGAYALTDFRAAIPGAGILLAGSIAFAILFIAFCWTKASSVARVSLKRVDARLRRAMATPGVTAPYIAALMRATDFVAFWANRTGAGRIALFILAYACLFVVSRAALDEKWVGMASALPLPGFFAVAALMDEAEHTSAAQSLLPMRDTLFLGPVLVIPFNWMFAHAMLAVPPAAFVSRYLLLFAFWTVAAVALVLLVPRMAAYLDRR